MEAQMQVLRKNCRYSEEINIKYCLKLIATPADNHTNAYELQRPSTLVPPVDGTYWHTRFGHFIGYGDGYYSYVYALVFAADIWRTIFNGPQGPLSYESGNTLFQKLKIVNFMRIEVFASSCTLATCSCSTPASNAVFLASELLATVFTTSEPSEIDISVTSITSGFICINCFFTADTACCRRVKIATLPSSFMGPATQPVSS
ncbi:hypothetical protein PsorP6_001524 [Peronosclerospora sorghi]|uniref:Uncharacterized protein n=1 Tax=Peronosclerospora sorghi TaxID=230839 RepID=A0ACC0WSN8_9STRA|nr:hypothetical protein PsorP6_001524 [Peronosclerospora sorghi]